MIADLYKGIKALLLSNFSTNYPSNAIIQGYQNNTVMPQNGQQIIMTALDNESHTFIPLYTYNATNETEGYTDLISTIFQVDIYGNPAQETARTFKLILDSYYAQQFFYENNYPCSVHKTYSIVNLTDTFGRDMYLPRFVVKFSLFNNTQFNTSSLGFTNTNIDIVLANVQKA